MDTMSVLQLSIREGVWITATSSLELITALLPAVGPYDHLEYVQHGLAHRP
jgi:hypothetical protein